MYHPGTAVAGAGGGTAAGLAFTGSYTLLLIAVAVTLVLGGLVLVAAASRGRKHTGATAI